MGDVEESNATKGLVHELLVLTQVSSTYIRRVLSGRFADCASLDNEQSLTAVQEHAGLIQGANIPSVELVENMEQAARMRPGGGSMLDRVEDVCKSLKNHFHSTLHAEARFR